MYGYWCGLQARMHSNAVTCLEAYTVKNGKSFDVTTSLVSVRLGV